MLRKLGPGLVTGAADDDPSGIATYSQAGARFGFDVLWSVALTYPLMVAIQMISARIGAASGKGLATNIRLCYSPWLLYPLVALLCVANIINIGADISAMGAAGALMLGGSKLIYVPVFGTVSLLLQVFVPYQRYVNYLKWLIAQLQKESPDSELYEAKVTVLHEYVDHHVKEEEKEMFPKVRKTDLDLDELGQVMAKTKEQLTQKIASH